jgi:hypothetical protein
MKKIWTNFEADRFVNDWLWYSKNRLTEGMPWEMEYKHDLVLMVMEAVNKVIGEENNDL